MRKQIGLYGAALMAALFLLGFILFGCTGPTIRVQKYTLEQVDSMHNDRIIALENRVLAIDSLEAQNKALIQAVVYLDSVNTARSSKADRAERRGRFFGGLIKTLIP
jgi:hypothetical protein